MKRSWMTAGLRSRSRRLLSAAVAIIIGVAFLAASLAALLTAKAGLEEAVGGQLRGADLVLTSAEGEPLDSSSFDAVAAVEGVRSVLGEAVVFADLGPEDYVLGANLPSAGTTLIEGRLPTASGEVLATKELAGEGTGTGTGSQLQLAIPTGEAGGVRSVTLDVVGVVDPGTNSPVSFGPGFLTDDATLRLVEPSLTYRSLQVDLTDAAPIDTTRAALADAVPGVLIQTGPQAAEDRVSELTGETNVLAGILLGFGAVALATAAIVIANTFTITLAQRTGELALLRCVGATKSQVRRLVLLEALALGVVASVLGVALGVLSARGLLALAQRADLGIPLGDSLVVGPATLLVPVLVGTIVTMLASFWPAVRATRVPALAALRPLGSSSERATIGAGRLLLALLLVAGGTALMLYAASHRDILTGVGGGLVSFVGVLVGAILVVPLAVRALGLGARAVGVPGRLAVDNAVRNPGRAAATSAALIVGVTLITMTSVGAASGEKTALGEIDKEYAIDLVVSTEPQLAAEPDADAPEPVRDVAVPTELGATVPEQLAGVKGVAATLAVDTAYLTLGESWAEAQAVGLDPASAGQVIRSQALVDQIKPGMVGLSDLDMSIQGFEAGDAVLVSGSVTSKELTVAAIGLGQSRLALHIDDLVALDGDQVRQGAALIRLDDKADVGKTYSGITEIAEETGLAVDGSAAERAAIARILDVLVLVTTALLGVAVVIAVIGIANTLSLSIIERHREHALLRALGLTRGQMRTMLLTEGVLLALVSACLGLALGVGYAALGIQTLLPADTPLDLAIPWTRVALIVAVALVAGILASVLPARRATRVSPAEGLATA